MNDPAVTYQQPASLAARAVRYVEIVTEIARLAKLPDYAPSAWNALTPLVASQCFLLVGRGKQALDWPAAIAAMDVWARGADFNSSLRRLEEIGQLVFMELDEQSTAQGQTLTLQTMTVFEFDAAGLLRRLDAFK